MGWVRKNTGIDLTGDDSLLGKTLQASESVVQKLGNTIESIVSDPRKLAAVGLMVAFPGAATSVGNFLLPEAAATALGTVGTAIVGQTAINTALNGGDLNAAVKAALVQQGLPAVTNSLAASQLGKDMQELFGKYGSQAATQAGLAAIMGKDPVAAFVFSGAQAATDLIMQQVGANEALNGLPQAAQNAVRATIAAGLTGKDAATAAANSLVNSMIKGGQTLVAAAAKTGGQTILTPEQVKAIGESPIQPTSGAMLDNTIKYAQLMNEGKVLNDPSTLTIVSALDPSGYAQLEKYQMSRVPEQVTAPSVPTDEVTAGTQQLIDAITNPQTTVSYPGTQVADSEGKTGVPSDQITDQDLEQLGVGLPIGDDFIGKIINFDSSGLNPPGPVPPAQSEYTGPQLPPGYTPPANTDLTQDDLINIIDGGQDSVMGGEATTQGGASTDIIQDDGTTTGIQDVIDTITGGDGTDIIQDDGTTTGIQDVIDTITGGDGTDTVDTTCADGFHWDDTLQICVADTDETQASTDCPDGYVYNVVTQACEPITTEQPSVVKPPVVKPPVVNPPPAQPSTQKPALTQQESPGLGLAALLALMGSGQQQTQPMQPQVADTSGMVDIETLLANPLQTDYRKLANKPKMAEGGSIDDLLALLNQKG